MTSKPNSVQVTGWNLVIRVKSELTEKGIPLKGWTKRLESSEVCETLTCHFEERCLRLPVSPSVVNLSCVQFVIIQSTGTQSERQDTQGQNQFHCGVCTGEINSILAVLFNTWICMMALSCSTPVNSNTTSVKTFPKKMKGSSPERPWRTWKQGNKKYAYIAVVWVLCMHTSSSCLPFTHVHRIRSGLLLHSSNRDSISLSNRMHMFRLATKYSYNRSREKLWLLAANF